jgi:hypothetical protein
MDHGKIPDHSEAFPAAQPSTPNVSFNSCEAGLIDDRIWPDVWFAMYGSQLSAIAAAESTAAPSGVRDRSMS